MQIFTETLVFKIFEIGEKHGMEMHCRTSQPTFSMLLSLLLYYACQYQRENKLCLKVLFSSF